MATIRPVRLDDDTPQGKMLREHKDRVSDHPNFYGTLAHSKAVFNGYLDAVAALGTGVLSEELSVQIGLTVSKEIDSPYCVRAHKNKAIVCGVSSTETELNVSGISSDSRTGLILDFVRKLVSQLGKVRESEVQLLRAQGVSNEEIVEIIAHTVLYMGCGIVNRSANTEIESD